jgi:hypothetical protein
VGLRAGLFHSDHRLFAAARGAPGRAHRRHARPRAPALFAAIRDEARQEWRRQRFFRLLNRMLFLAGSPDRRWRVMQRFYRLPASLIARFYAGRLSLGDKARLVSRQAAGPAARRLSSPPARSIPTRSGKQNERTEHRTAPRVVIGAGFGGLALAIRLQARGIQTTLLEKRDKPGGRAYVYEDQGFVFDAGPTVITDPSCIEELFTLAGKRMADYVEMLPVAPFYRLCWEDGSHFDYANDQEALDRQIHARNPADVAGYRRFLAYSQAVFAEGYLKLGAVPFLSFRDMVAAGPQLAKLQAWRSVYGIVSRFIQDEQLRQAFSFHSLLVGGNPFATSSIYTLIHALEREWGVWFPRGGTGALVRGAGAPVRGPRRTHRAECAGGAHRGQRRARQRRAAGRRAHVRGGRGGLERRRGAHLRQAAGAASARRGAGAALAKKRFSNSLFVLYFGLDHHHSQLRTTRSASGRATAS